MVPGFYEEVEAELAGVELALRRLEDGTYGYCERCGQPIGEATLEADPTVLHCSEHVGALRPASPGTHEWP